MSHYGPILMLRRLSLGLIILLTAMVAGIEGHASEKKSDTAARSSSAPASAEKGNGFAGSNAELSAAKTSVVIIPVREQIDSPSLFIIRRGLKEAIEQKADVIVLDMKTPGGSAQTTLEIMEALDKFPGRTITYVNDEAGSAGAIIAAVTDDIYFAPNGVMGAAELIFGSGQDVGEGLKRKMNSYLGAKIRAFSGEQPMRSDVLEAMMDPEFELTIDGKVIKPKGKLLTLTAREAMATYGDPPAPLLATGIAESIEDLLRREYGENGYTVRALEVTWSERLAVLLRALSPLLLGIGLLGLYIEFKTPGFGVFGIAGICCLVVVFLSNYVAGLSGHEPMLLFAVGLLLVFIELLLFPGIVFVALTGMILMLGSLVWSMADIWPNEPFQFSGDLLLLPLRDLLFGILVAIGLALALARFIPRGWFFSQLAVGSPVSGSAQSAGSAPEVGALGSALVGRIAVAATGLYPTGQIEIDGRRYEARLEVGSAAPGTRVIVRRKTDFGFLVDREKAPSP